MLRRCAASPAAKRPLRMLRRGAPRRRLAPLFPPLHPHLSPFVFDFTVITALTTATIRGRVARVYTYDTIFVDVPP